MKEYATVGRLASRTKYEKYKCMHVNKRPLKQPATPSLQQTAPLTNQPEAPPAPLSCINVHWSDQNQVDYG